MTDADDVLAHSTDDGEWDEAPTSLEARPTGSQVLTVSLSDELAERLFAETARTGRTLSEVVAVAVEAYVH